MIELGNAAQKGQYKWKTHARYRPNEKKKLMQKYKIHDKIEKRKWICNTDLRVNVKLVWVYYTDDGTRTT